jgi:hypothetical protein
MNGHDLGHSQDDRTVESNTWKLQFRRRCKQISLDLCMPEGRVTRGAGGEVAAKVGNFALVEKFVKVVE